MYQNRILVDSGFLIALVDKSDEYHDKAIHYFTNLKFSLWVIPWVVLIESFRERFLKPRILPMLKDFMESASVLVEEVSIEVLEASKSKCLNRSMSEKPRSITDEVLLNFLTNYDFDGFISCNPRDFEFICSKENITFINLKSEVYKYGY